MVKNQQDVVQRGKIPHKIPIFSKNVEMCPWSRCTIMRDFLMGEKGQKSPPNSGFFRVCFALRGGVSGGICGCLYFFFYGVALADKHRELGHLKVADEATGERPLRRNRRLRRLTLKV